MEKSTCDRCRKPLKAVYVAGAVYCSVGCADGAEVEDALREITPGRDPVEHRRAADGLLAALRSLEERANGTGFATVEEARPFINRVRREVADLLDGVAAPDEGLQGCMVEFNRLVGRTER